MPLSLYVTKILARALKIGFSVSIILYTFLVGFFYWLAFSLKTLSCISFVSLMAHPSIHPSITTFPALRIPEVLEPSPAGHTLDESPVLFHLSAI